MTAPTGVGASELIVRSPADGRHVGVVADLSSAVVAQTLSALREAQQAWEQQGVEARVSWVRRYRDWLLDNQDRLHTLLQEETGKPWGQATVEGSFAVHHITYYASLALKHLDERKVRSHSVLTGGKRQQLRLRPYPVVGVISPWNFPLAISLIDSVPALLAGAAVAVKPSEVTPLTVSAAIAGWEEIGAPPVYASVTGGPAAGQALVDGVDYVQFTGSTATGRRVAQRCAERLVPCSLELGGKDPMIVLRGADLARASNAAVWGGLANSGQMCTSVERIYVEESIHDAFVDKLVDEVKRLRVGHDDNRARYDIGPLATPAQVELVRIHIDDAVSKGARVLVGGGSDGAIVQPTVIVDVDHTMLCMQDETFGPLLPVMAVPDAEAAVDCANDTPYGLSAHVFGPETSATRELARRLHVGAVNVNDVAANLTALALPQSGWKQSGLGARNGAEHGLLKYCRTQAIVSARVPLRREPYWFPFTPLRVALLSRLMRLASAHDIARRLGLPRGSSIPRHSHRKTEN